MVNPSWQQFSRPSDNYEKKQLSEEVPGDLKDNLEPEGKKPQWGDLKTPSTYQGEVDPTADEGVLQYFTRNALSNAARIGEQIAGRYGNIEKFAKNTLADFPTTGGIIGWSINKLIGEDNWKKLILGEGHQMFPTSEELKKVTNAATFGYTEPKTKGEKQFQEFSEDVGATITGRTPRVPGTNQARQIAINNLLIPAAANATKKIMQDTGFSEDSANLAKLAVWIPLSFLTNVNAPRYASSLMNRGREGVPQNLQFNTQRFLNRLNQVEGTLLSSDPRTQLARTQINQLRNDIANGQTTVRDAMTMFDGTNALKRSRGMFDMNRTDQNFARSAIDRVKNVVRDEVLDAGAQFPQAIDNWRNGVQSWAVIHSSRGITNWIEDIAKGPYSKILSGPAAALFGVGAYGASKVPMVSGAISGVVPATYKTIQTGYRVFNDPRLANYYWNAIGAAQEKNLPAFLNNYLKLEDKLNKSDSTKVKSSTKK